jgi:hypothetical protein
MRIRSAVLPIASLVAALMAAHQARASSSHADITVDTSLHHMSLSVTQGTGGGCLGGFVFQGAWGGCVRQSVDTDIESRACADGAAEQTRARSRLRYSHQNGSVRYGAYGAWSGWSTDCSSASGPSFPEPPAPGPAAPEPAAPEPPGLPQVGTTYSVDAWVCDNKNASYPVPAGPSNSNRNRLISTYMAFNFYRRCPERLGYQYWIEQWNLAAQAYASQNKTPLSMAYDVTFGMSGAGIKNRMLDQARDRGEHLPDIIDSMDAECQMVADTKYGAGRITAVYDTAGNGSRCKVVRVH